MILKSWISTVLIVIERHWYMDNVDLIRKGLKVIVQAQLDILYTIGKSKMIDA